MLTGFDKPYFFDFIYSIKYATINYQKKVIESFDCSKSINLFDSKVRPIKFSEKDLNKLCLIGY